MHTTKGLTFLINTVFGIALLVLGLRFILKLFAARPAPFVRWVYDSSQPLLNPFFGMFPSPVIEGGSIFEFTTLFAILIYALVARLLMLLIARFHAYSHPQHTP